MVNDPVPATFATELPDTVPISPLDSTATLAGPPDAQPATAFARSMKNPPQAPARRLQVGTKEYEQEGERRRDAQWYAEGALGREEQMPDKLLRRHAAMCQMPPASAVAGECIDQRRQRHAGHRQTDHPPRAW